MKSLLISSRKGLIVYTKSNGGWQYKTVHFNGIPVCLTYYDDAANELWAFLDHGHWGVKMQKSKDFGESWEEIPALKYPEGCEVKEGVPAALQYIWAVQKDLHGRIWIGTVPGGLFMSDDGGATFQLNQGLWNHPHREKHWFGGGMDHPGVHSIVLDPADPNHMFVGVSVGGVYETTDGGETWQVRNSGLRADFMPDPHGELSHDPHLLVACPNSPQHMWQQNHCGIFKSTDGAKSWLDVTQKDGPANFGFAVEVDEKDPDTAWVVPGVSDEIRVAVDHSLWQLQADIRGRITLGSWRSAKPLQNWLSMY